MQIHAARVPTVASVKKDWIDPIVDYSNAKFTCDITQADVFTQPQH